MKKYKIVEVYKDDMFSPYYLVLKRKSFFVWSYVRDNAGRKTIWGTRRGAQAYINQEVKRLGL